MDSLVWQRALTEAEAEQVRSPFSDLLPPHAALPFPSALEMHHRQQHTPDYLPNTPVSCECGALLLRAYVSALGIL